MGIETLYDAKLALLKTKEGGQKDVSSQEGTKPLKKKKKKTIKKKFLPCRNSNRGPLKPRASVLPMSYADLFGLYFQK